MTIHVLPHVVDGRLNELKVYRDFIARIRRPVNTEELRVLVF
ncbi:MAG TPA: hypothetical protein VG142_01400 [Trebonia sp.]|jgi:hypothetical protein|nr:hypothetical protein [Trebonia sp.]